MATLPASRCVSACKRERVPLCSGSRTSVPRSPRVFTGHGSPQLRAVTTAAKAREGNEPQDLLVDVCPVPREQQPMQEWLALSNDGFFKWAALPAPQFAARLAGVFAFFFVAMGLPVSAVTFSMETELLQCMAASTLGSGFITLVLVLRMYLGYSYVGNRLLSATVEYEESGWYDGMTWVKTPQMLMRDRLLGTYQVRPLLDKLKKTLIGLSGAMAAATVLLVTAPPPQVNSAELSYSSSSSSRVSDTAGAFRAQEAGEQWNSAAFYSKQAQQ